MIWEFAGGRREFIGRFDHAVLVLEHAAVFNDRAAAVRKAGVIRRRRRVPGLKARTVEWARRKLVEEAIKEQVPVVARTLPLLFLAPGTAYSIKKKP